MVDDVRNFIPSDRDEPLIAIGNVTFAPGVSEAKFAFYPKGEEIWVTIKSNRQFVTIYAPANYASLSVDAFQDSLSLVQSGPLVTSLGDTHEYIVTAVSHDVLDALYDDIETPGCGSSHHCPDRACECVDRQPGSRNTTYLLHMHEAEELKKDPRVSAVCLPPEVLGIVPMPIWEQTSSNFDKRTASINNTMINWALLSGTNSNLTPYGQDLDIPDTGSVLLNSATGVVSGTPASVWRASRTTGITDIQLQLAVRDSSNPSETATNIGSFWAGSYSPGHITNTPNTTGFTITRGDPIFYTHSTLSGGTPPYVRYQKTQWRDPVYQAGLLGDATTFDYPSAYVYECDEEVWMTAKDSSTNPVVCPISSIFRIKILPRPSDPAYTVSPHYPDWRNPLDLGNIPSGSTTLVSSSTITLAPVNTSFNELWVDCYMMSPSEPLPALGNGIWTYTLTANGANYDLQVHFNPRGLSVGNYLGLIRIAGPGESFGDNNLNYKNLYVKATIASVETGVVAVSSRAQYKGGYQRYHQSYDGTLDVILRSNTALTPWQPFPSVTGGTAPYTFYWHNRLGFGLNNKQLTAGGTIKTQTSGKNVDVLIIDEGGSPANHPEFAKNSDGTGGSRVKTNHSPAVDHSTHVASTVAGNTLGWARDADIHHMSFYTSKVFQAAKTWHNNKTINQTTGRKNPTVVNNSWGYFGTYLPRWTFDYTLNVVKSVTYRGTTYTNPCEAINRPFGLIDYQPSNTAVPLSVRGWAPYPKCHIRIQEIIEKSTNKSNSSQVAVEPYLSGWVNSLNAPMAGRTGLTPSTTPTVGDNVNGYWTINLPWSVKILNPRGVAATPITTSTVWVSTKGYISFTAPPSTPGAGKTIEELPGLSLAFYIGDNSCFKIYTGSVSPNDGVFPSAFKIRWEGHSAPTGGKDYDPSLVWEVIFYPPVDDPSQPTLYELTQMHIRMLRNNMYNTTWRVDELAKYGLLLNFRNVSNVVPSVDADIEDCIANGMIMVGAAGNDAFPICDPSDVDYNNYITVFPFSYYLGPGVGSNSYGNVLPQNEYYMRAGTPAQKCFTVGALGADGENKRAWFSNYGTGVEIWAPGEAIMGAYASNTAYLTPAVQDSRNTSFYLQKSAGTSMASPQIAGLIALALETNPRMDQQAAKAYIKGQAQPNVWNTPVNPVDTNSIYSDPLSLNGSSPQAAFYKADRPANGQLTPTNTLNARPAQGQAYPRNRIYRYGKRV